MDWTDAFVENQFFAAPKINGKNIDPVTGNKTRYLNFCQHHPAPLHAQPWWLDAVCGSEQWDVGLTENAAREITGCWPYFLQRRGGISMLRQPPLTTYGGPWLHYPANPDFKTGSRYDFEQKTCTALLQQLPANVFFQQNLYPAITNGLPFHWAGFHLNTRYTYLLAAPDENWPAALSSSTRKKIRQAEADYQVEMTDQFDDFWPIYLAGSPRRIQKPVRESLLRSLDEAAEKNQARHIFITRHRQSGHIQNVQYLTRDHRSAYGLLSGFQPDTPLNHANYLLYAAILDFCVTQKLAFDFEGSMDAGVGHVFQHMGAVCTPYLQISKGKKWVEIVRLVNG